MPQLTVTKSYLNGNVLAETNLDDVKNALETFFNTTKIDSYNIQNQAITAALIANNTITATQIANGTITTTQIAAGTIQATNIASATITSTQLATSAVATANIADSAVTTAKIADSAITSAKLASAITAVNTAVSSSCGSVIRTQTVQTLIDNQTVAITTTGKPVMVTLEPASTGTSTGVTPPASGATMSIFFTRDGSNIACHGAAGAGLNFPPGSFSFLDDAPAAGAHTYTAAYLVPSGTTVFSNFRIRVTEIK